MQETISTRPVRGEKFREGREEAEERSREEEKKSERGGEERGERKEAQLAPKDVEFSCEKRKVSGLREVLEEQYD
ncbi:hypothetical protein POX_a00070 [Penicillium oxalicum]|uniref:Uncharacterized protein n=1 Tax=Penicillium oxalicum (strain 114-2 / CGMCC 5302) TaxID=933388 RepID=S8A1F4_PENO1|nr:hypothetical protein POX_a00070 [Penicillium oxalicum]EPS34961.1 hypothetical protein PDE_09926 [Penicillium oxalicum 114-2]KAI2793490.1 hypothetical protein POX_a00070 [Penicillium oxalicum]